VTYDPRRDTLPQARKEQAKALIARRARRAQVEQPERQPTNPSAHVAPGRRPK